MEGDGPRAVLFVDEEESLNQAFIVADEDLVIEIDQPTTIKAAASLIACYYTFHREFPLAYRNFLQFIAYSVFAAEIKSVAAQKYLRDIRNFENTNL